MLSLGMPVAYRLCSVNDIKLLVNALTTFHIIRVELLGR
jgi:hypothetical protein